MSHVSSVTLAIAFVLRSPSGQGSLVISATTAFVKAVGGNKSGPACPARTGSLPRRSMKVTLEVKAKTTGHPAAPVALPDSRHPSHRRLADSLRDERSRTPVVVDVIRDLSRHSPLP